MFSVNKRINLRTHTTAFSVAYNHCYAVASLDRILNVVWRPHTYAWVITRAAAS